MRIAFGDCEFDTARRVLLRGGTAVPLSVKAFELLEVLLDRRPEAIAKGDLLERLWPKTFVSDASLHNLVAEIRAALGDTPQTARYIRTVPRFGYAFQGDARLASAADPLPGAASGARLVSGEREWLLTEGTNLVGRDRDCGVRIDSTTLSRHHARILVSNGEATIEDLGSKNGTHVNGTRLSNALPLKDSDEIQVGAVTLRYRMLEPLPSTLTRGA
jgi:DNA-binding winged helix-turn-helix (wHTH) protein